MNVTVTSNYDLERNEPIVLLVSENGTSVVLSPENARDLALNLLQAVEASYSDAFLYEFMSDAIEADQNQVGALLNEFRAWREQKQTW
jgi:hypothetical protein